MVWSPSKAYSRSNRSTSIRSGRWGRTSPTPCKGWIFCRTVRRPLCRGRGRQTHGQTIRSDVSRSKAPTQKSIKRWTRLSPRRVFKSSRCRRPPEEMGAGQEGWQYNRRRGRLDQRQTVPFCASGVAARTKSAIRAGRIAYVNRLRKAVARQAEWQNTLEGLQESGLHRSADLANDAAADSAEFENRHPGSAHARLQNTVAVNFAGNPALAVPVPLRGCESSRDEPGIDRAAAGRGGAPQRRPVGRERGQESLGKIRLDQCSTPAGVKSASVKCTSWSMRAPLNSVTLFFRGPWTVRPAGIG